ncbi:hypothetical protein ACFQ0B_74090 [Nonomuraea thailandensis]
MIALAVFRLAAYVRSHRVYQAFLLTLALLAIVHGSRAPRGAEATVLVDGAILLVPILAWAARSLLDTEPDRQREMSAIQVGGRGKEVAAGLLAAFTACAVFAALGLFWALLAGSPGRRRPACFWPHSSCTCSPPWQAPPSAPSPAAPSCRHRPSRS